jgi:hypothetical protein
MDVSGIGLAVKKELGKSPSPGPLSPQYICYIFKTGKICNIIIQADVVRVENVIVFAIF